MKIDAEYVTNLVNGTTPELVGVEREIMDCLLAAGCIQDSVHTTMIKTLAGNPMQELAVSFMAMWSMGFQMGRIVEQAAQLEALAAAGND